MNPIAIKMMDMKVLFWSRTKLGQNKTKNLEEVRW